MMVLITYDLTQPGRDYEKLFAAIRALGNWCHALESVWILDTQWGAIQIRDNLKLHVDANDKIFTVRMQRDWGSWNLSKEIIDWLNGPRNW